MRANRKHTLATIAGTAIATMLIAPLVSFGTGAAPPPGGSDVNDLPMADGVGNWNATSVFTVGETVASTGALNPWSAPAYTPPGVLDGLGAYALDGDTVRVFANHELLNFRAYPYQVSDGSGGTFSMPGGRISYFDIDKDTRHVVDSGLAYNTIYDATGAVATDASFLPNNLAGLSRFCSGSLFEPEQFGSGQGFADRIYMAGEEDGGEFSPTGGAEWALDPETGDFWALPDLGRGAWENATPVQTGSLDTVAVLLGDDTSPFDFDPGNANGDEAAPMFLYVGEKDPSGDFPARNGLRGGKLHVWVADNGETTPADFNGHGTLKGRWVEIDNGPTGPPSEDGSTGYDEFGYPTQGNLWLQATALGAFGFSRPEDVATNPKKGNQVAIASTGVADYVGGADSFGTIYTLTTNFRNMRAQLGIVYDGDNDPTRALRNPDNLDWADDGRLYIQEDEAHEVTLAGEPLFGEGAANPDEAGIVRMRPNGKQIQRIANVNRGVSLDSSLANPTMAFDTDFGNAGEWESSGIVDVSNLFDKNPGELFLFDVQAHGIEDQAPTNPTSRIVDGDLVEGGQLLFLEQGH